MTAMDAPIGRGMSEVLQVKGALRQPQEIDYEGPARCVWPLDAGGFASALVDQGQYTAQALAGVSNLSKEMVSAAGKGGVVALRSRNFRVLGVYGNIGFDAAGAAAFAGKRVEMIWSLFAEAANFQVDIFGVRDTVIAAQTGYRLHPQDSQSFIAIPDGYRLRAMAISLDGTVFPANTTLSTGVIGYSMPVDARLPL